MNEHFDSFASYMNRRLEHFSKGELFCVDAEDLNASYLAAFPEGSNPVFRVRTEHDCSCCRNFVRNFGGVFAIKNGKRQSLWADETLWAETELREPYLTVVKTMHNLILQLPIKGVFRTDQKQFGSMPNFDKKDSNIRWNHLFGRVASRHHNASPAEAIGAKNATAHVFKRGLEELTTEALSTVRDLIDSNSLYRGEEHRPAVNEFSRVHAAYRAASEPDLFVWENLDFGAARFRNTVIGTLVEDLSAGKPVEDAVRMFESKVAPQNYKRTSAPITAKMVAAAETTLREMGLESAIERRFAKISDVSVNDVLFVDNAVRNEMKGGLAGILAGDIKSQPVDMKHATNISMEDFLKNVIPSARRIEVLVKNEHAGNFVSLTAPVHENNSETRLFKWNNDFAWSYAGEVADSVKQRVKRAGGNIQADLRVSLAWFNTDDLDLHAVTPAGHIHFANKKNILDVDMNFVSLVRDPVENLSWIKPINGEYKIFVHQFTKRESHDVGFSIEIECNGILQQFSYSLALPLKNIINCFSFNMRDGKLINFKLDNSNLSGETQSKEIWRVKTETLVPVSTLMYSPNHWEGAGSVGNRHWFFMLENCLNPDAARGMYNEYLNNALTPHSKVFEVLASRMKCRPVSDPKMQLSGLGFSSTKRDTLTVKVTNAISTRAYNINF